MQELIIFGLLITLTLCESFAHKYIILEAFGVRERIFNRAWHISFSTMWFFVWVIMAMTGTFFIALLHATLRLTLFQWALNIWLRIHSTGKEAVTTVFAERKFNYLSSSGIDGLVKELIGESWTFWIKLSLLALVSTLYFIFA